MAHLLLGAILCASVALVACQKSATEQQAQAVSDSGRGRAEVVRARAENEANTLDERAADLGAKAKATGGYSGERLSVQADAYADEADIVRKQGRAQAEAIEEAANAEAKATRSR